MKKITLYFLAFLTCIKVDAQKINFETDWKIAVEKATKEKKLIFMDVYTTWCHPCKLIDKNVFTDSVVYKYYNENFINLKCNAEQGWGIKAAKHYQIFIYPSFLFINPESLEVYYRIKTSNPGVNFFKNEGIIANREKNEPSLNELMTRYEKGGREINLFKKILQRKSNCNIDFSKELLEYIRIYPFNELKRNCTLNYNCLNIQYGTTEYFQIKNTVKKDIPIDEILMGSVKAIMDTAIKIKDEVLMEKMLSEMAFLGTTNRKIDYLRIDFYQKTENFKRAYDFTEGYISKYLLNENIDNIKARDSIVYQNSLKPYLTGQKDSLLEKDSYDFEKNVSLNNEARLIASQIDYLIQPIVLKIADKDALKNILKWSAYCIALEPNFPGLNQTYAIALYRNNKYSEAITVMTTAVEQFEKISNQNISENMDNEVKKMKSLLEKIKNRTL